MIHFFYGANGYQIKGVLDVLVVRAKKKYGEHAVERADAEGMEASQLLDLLQGATLFAPERLVILQGAAKNKVIWELLGERLEAMPAFLHLAVVETSPDKRTKTFKALFKYADVHECKDLDEFEAAKWLSLEAKKRGGEIRTGEANLLVARAGIDQWRLSNELDKLLLHGAVTAEAIESLVEATPQANAFGLLDAVMQRKPEIVRKLLAEAKLSEDPYMLFGLLSSQIMLLSALVYGKGRSVDDIAALLKTHPFPLKKLSPIAARMTTAQLREMVGVVAELDDNTKSTGIDSWMLLEHALIKIATR